MAANGERSTTAVKRVRRPAKKMETRAVIMPAPDQIVPEVSVSRPVATAPRRGAFSHIPRRQQNAFLRELIMLLEAGTPILKALRTLEARARGSIKYLIADVTAYVEQGNPLWQALDRHPQQFSQVDVNLVKASEASGNLVPVLHRLVSYRERRELLRKRVQGAMFYPVILLIACAAVFALIVGFVIPQFDDMFKKLNKELPAPTKAALWFGHFVAHWWWVGVLIVLAVVIIYWLIGRYSRRWRVRFDHWKLHVPVIGKTLQGLAIVEFCRSIALLLKSGLSMMATLDLTRSTVHNQAVAVVIQNIRDSVERGAGIEPPLREAPGVIPPVVTDMLVTGEEAGQLDKISEQVADTYQEEVNIRVATIGDALVPIVTVFIGVVVGTLAVTMFWPLISMVQQLGNSGM